MQTPGRMGMRGWLECILSLSLRRSPSQQLGVGPTLGPPPLGTGTAYRLPQPQPGLLAFVGNGPAGLGGLGCSIAPLLVSGRSGALLSHSGGEAHECRTSAFPEVLRSAAGAKRQWWDPNPRTPAPKADALSIRPHRRLARVGVHPSHLRLPPPLLGSGELGHSPSRGHPGLGSSPHAGYQPY